MDITIADKAGYCFGITNAINTVDNLNLEETGPVYMLGDLSHNRQEMERLYSKGIKRVDSIEELKDGKVIIRTHGESKDVIDRVQEKGLEFIDVTCPFVKKVHKIISEYDALGYQIIIIGDKNHPEVIGSAGWAVNHKPIVIESVNEAKLLKRYDKICIVAQTTIIKDKFDKVTEVLKQKAQDICIFNTICTATEERQKAAIKLAENVNGMVVVGGYHSSNTQKLSELCTVHCNKTWLVETAEDLDLEEIRKLDKIGVTAGASTPSWLIKEVTERMEDEKTTLTTETTEDTNVGTEEMVNEEIVQDNSPDNISEDIEMATSEPENQESDESVTEEATNAEESVAVEEQPVVEEESVTEETAETPVSEEVVSEEVVTPQDTELSTTSEEFIPGEEAGESFDFASAIDNYTKPIHKNSVVEGTVLEVSDDEVIVNIGQKSDALILKRDFTWKRDEELKDIVKVGDKVTAIVTDLNTNDNEGKYKLSKIKYDNKQVNDRLRKAYENREVLYGKVSAVTNGHLWVDVGFTEIFMPASQYHLHFIKDLDALVGNNVRGILIDYEPSRSRAVLSQKVLLAEERDERLREQQEIRDRRYEELNIDDVITGKVKTITDFGVFVDLDGIDGFIHRSDLTWERNNEPKRLVKIGDEIESKVILKNEDEKKIKLSVKDLQEKPWDRFVKSYLENDEIEVTITNTLDFGAFAQVIPGVEGLIHISEISYDRVESVNDVLKTGDVVKVKIIKIDEDNEKISLSIKATLPRPERIKKTQEEADYEFEEYGSKGRRNNRNKRKNRRQNNNRDNIYYEESADYSLGSTFGELLNSIDFSSLGEDTEEVIEEQPVVEEETVTETETAVEEPVAEETSVEETVETTDNEE